MNKKQFNRVMNLLVKEVSSQMKPGLKPARVMRSAVKRVNRELQKDASSPNSNPKQT